MSEKSTEKLDALVKEKMSAGLPKDTATECALAQIAHDEQLAAEAETAAKKKK